jgi:hypothetical protein
MKLELNLALQQSRRDRFAMLIAGPLTLLAVAGLLLLGASAGRNWRAYLDLRESTKPLASVEAELRQRESALKRELERPQSREIYRRVQMVNGLFERRQFSLTELTAELSRLVPGDVRLSSLAYVESGDAPVVRLGFVAAGETAMEEFLVKLEDTPRFSEVVILSQGFLGDDSEGGTITVACAARYHWRTKKANGN